MMALTPHLFRSFLCMLAASLVTALVAPGSGSAQPAAPKALVAGGTVLGSPSQEEQAAIAQGFVVTVASAGTWAEMSQTEFGAYDLLIIGDAACSSAPQTAAANAATWAPVVMGTAGGRTIAGNRILIGTDPVYHDAGDVLSERATIIREGVTFAGKRTGGTGLYFNASCGGGGGNVLTALGLLSTGSGAWTENSNPPCGGNVSLIASESSFATLTTASLADWGCSVHESWPTFPTDWNALAVATDTPTTPTCGVDPNTELNACGEAYILIAGSSIVVTSDSIAVTPTDATNPAGTNHTLTAHVTRDGSPLAEQAVIFTVIGQNSGATGTCVPAGCVTDANGDVSFTYHDGNGAGDDTIKASFTDVAGSLQSASGQKHWLKNADFPGVTFGDWAEAVEVHVGLNSEDQEIRTAYLALRAGGVKILDVTDPDEIATLGSYAPATCRNGKSTAAFFADDVEFVEELSALFVAVGRCGVLVLNVANPAIPVVLGYYDTPGWVDALAIELSDTRVIGYLADHNGGLVIVDFSNLFKSKPSAPKRLGGISSGKAWGTGAAVDVALRRNGAGLLAFVAASQGLRVVDVSKPSSPRLIGGFNTSPGGTPPEVPQDIVLSEDGNIALLSGWQAGLLAIDVSDPTHPTLQRRIPTTLAYYKSEIDGDLVLATEGKVGLREFALGTDGLQTLEGEEPMPIADGNGWAWDVQVVGGVAYVTYGILEDGTGGLVVIGLAASD